MVRERYNITWSIFTVDILIRIMIDSLPQPDHAEKKNFPNRRYALTIALCAPA